MHQLFIQITLESDTRNEAHYPYMVIPFQSALTFTMKRRRLAIPRLAIPTLSFAFLFIAGPKIKPVLIIELQNMINN